MQTCANLWPRLSTDDVKELCHAAAEAILSPSSSSTALSQSMSSSLSSAADTSMTATAGVDDIDNKAHGLFLLYLDLLFAPPNSLARRNADCVHQYIEACLRDRTPPRAKLFADNGRGPIPSSNAHRVRWPREAFFTQSLLAPTISLLSSPSLTTSFSSATNLPSTSAATAHPLTQDYVFDAALVIELFSNFGYWKGFVTLVRSIEEEQGSIYRARLAEVLYCLGDRQLLSLHPWTREVWIMILELATSRAALQTLSPDDVLRMLIMQCGAEEALAVVSSLVPTPVLSQNFLDGCVAAAHALFDYQNSIRQSLSKIDSYLWTQRPAALHPSVTMVLDEESKASLPPMQFIPNGSVAWNNSYMSGSGSNQNVLGTSAPSTVMAVIGSTVNASTIGSASAPISGSSTPFPTTSYSLDETLEDHGAHWGTVISLEDNCRVCEGLLRESRASLTAFKCGHIYHADCVPEDACPSCFHRQCASLGLSFEGND